jgi:hypothetical protein
MPNKLAQIQIPRSGTANPLPHTGPAYPMTSRHLGHRYPFVNRYQCIKNILGAIYFAG